MVDFFWFSLRFRPFQVENFLEKNNRQTLFECYVMATFSHLLRPKCNQAFCLVMLQFRGLLVCNVMVKREPAKREKFLNRFKETVVI